MAGSILAASIANEVGPLQGGNGGGPIVLLLFLAFLILPIAGMAKTFQKANQPWWGAIIPIYNVYLMLKIIGRPGWWLILFLIPLVNLVVGILVTVELAKAFGKGVGFALGLLILGFIFFPILGFGDARYQGAPN